MAVFETSGRDGSQLRRALACLRLDGMTRVITAQTGDDRQAQVASYVSACYRDAQLD